MIQRPLPQHRLPLSYSSPTAFHPLAQPPHLVWHAHTLPPLPTQHPRGTCTLSPLLTLPPNPTVARTTRPPPLRLTPSLPVSCPSPACPPWLPHARLHQLPRASPHFFVSSTFPHGWRASWQGERKEDREGGRGGNQRGGCLLSSPSLPPSLPGGPPVAGEAEEAKE